ncbi:hypothetical protein N0V88_007342 [Collariella sp. IMI 366227]|nr:hypothetical protein N0V88_007342 [Collariella sp. IMI 366227]
MVQTRLVNFDQEGPLAINPHRALCLGQDKPQFELIQAKAKQQLDDDNGPAACDRETVALQIAWLNRQYRMKSMYFALLDAPGVGISAFPPHEVDEGFLFYQHQDGI